MKHVCVAARIGDGEALDAGNIETLLASRATRPAPILAATLLGLARVLAHGIVAPLANIRDIGCGKLRALSQNRDSASRVSLCYGL